jgi:hypothetical protein
MIIIKTPYSDFIINEVEVASIIYRKEDKEAKVFYKDGVTTDIKFIDRIDMHPGTPDMTFVNNVEPETEPEPEPKDYEDDSILVLYKELKRIEEEEKERKKAEHPEWKYIQKKGTATRAIVVARQHDINTIGDLLKVGRVTFQGFRNAGPKCGKLITQGLSNLYGIEKW